MLSYLKAIQPREVRKEYQARDINDTCDAVTLYYTGGAMHEVFPHVVCGGPRVRKRGSDYIVAVVGKASVPQLPVWVTVNYQYRYGNRGGHAGGMKLRVKGPTS